MRRWIVGLIVVIGLAAAARSNACPCGDEKQPAQAKAAGAHVTLAIDGMTCASCGVAIRVTLKKLDGVKDATVSFDDKRAEVTYDPSRVTPQKMIKAIEDAGYKARVEKGGGGGKA
jgi:mercuric transport protein